MDLDYHRLLMDCELRMVFIGLKLQNKDYAIEITCGLKRLKYFHLFLYRKVCRLSGLAED